MGNMSQKMLFEEKHFLDGCIMPQKILNKKEIKKILEIIKSQWDAEPELDYAFFISEKDKVYIVNKEIGEYDLSRLRINSVGIYFGELFNGTLRLSIEGSQIIGPHAKKNVVELKDEEMKKWLNGQDITIAELTDISGFVIIKNKKDFYGCGKVAGNRILNFVPKARRVKTVS